MRALPVGAPSEPVRLLRGVIGGEEDADAGLKTVTRKARKAEAMPGIRREVLRGIGHQAPLECPAQFAAVVRHFLAEPPETCS